MKNKNMLIASAATVALLIANSIQAQTSPMFASNRTLPTRTSSATTPPQPLLMQLTQTEPQFGGGVEGWNRFVAANLLYPEYALDNNIWGDVELAFTVNADSSVSKIEALEGDAELKAQAVRLLQLSSGKWSPANQNGYKIPFRQRLKIRFVIAEK